MKYYSRNDAPLAFHTFYRFVSLPLGTLLSIFIFYNEIRNIGRISLLVFFDMVMVIALVFVSTAAFIGFFKWKSYAWYCVMARTGIAVINSVVIIVICIWYLPGNTATSSLIVRQISTLVVTGLITVYYYKRKPLFFEKYQCPPPDSFDELSI